MNTPKLFGRLGSVVSGIERLEAEDEQSGRSYEEIMGDMQARFEQHVSLFREQAQDNPDYLASHYHRGEAAINVAAHALYIGELWATHNQGTLRSPPIVGRGE
jgi:hypothetical protein